jgi:hypothetical protein
MNGCNDVPSRWRLCLASLWLAVVALFDPVYVASIFALGLEERWRLERKQKAESLCNAPALSDSGEARVVETKERKDV